MQAIGSERLVPDGMPLVSAGVDSGFGSDSLGSSRTLLCTVGADMGFVPVFAGGGFMLDYRLYSMNARTGHIESVEDFSAAGDAEAISVAERRVGEQPLELWCGHRKVRHYPAGDGFMGEAFYPPRDYRAA